MEKWQRSTLKEVVDFITFPIRAVAPLNFHLFGLTKRPDERFFYAGKEVQGYCLDVGCGPYNRFINEHLKGNGKGIDLFKYDGLADENILEDPTAYHFDNETFDSITFISSLNHIPPQIRKKVLKEIYRVLKFGGNVIVTMGNPVAEILIHHLVHFYDNIFGTKYDTDSFRGMVEGEQYFLTDREIKRNLADAGFKDILKKYFTTQYFLNHLFVGWKKQVQ